MKSQDYRDGYKAGYAAAVDDRRAAMLDMAHTSSISTAVAAAILGVDPADLDGEFK